MQQLLDKFLGLARNGQSATASDAEHAAYRLAYAVLDDVQHLDETELRGLTVFIGLAKTVPGKMLELLEADPSLIP